MPKTLNARFKKCGEADVPDTPGGTLEMSTVHGAGGDPCFMGDPSGAYGAGQYPKSAGLQIFYDNCKIKSAWSKATISTSQDTPAKMFMYPHISGTPRHVDTDGIDQMCMIPRIKFKKFPMQRSTSGQERTQSIFMRVSMKSMFPKWAHSEKDSVSTFGGGSANKIFFHCGIVTSVATRPLESVLVHSIQNVGITTTMFRRDEVANP